LVKDIYFYINISSWLSETPDGVLKGAVISKTGNYLEILDENGYTQIINLEKLFAVVY
jgi:hypothetical protein